MVYRRTRRAPMRRRPRRIVRRKQTRFQQLAGIAADTMRFMGPMGRAISNLRNLVNTEAKFNDVTISQFPDELVGSVVPLTLLSQGTTDLTRIGNSVLAKDLSVKLSFAHNAGAGLTPIRWSIVLDKQNALGTAPTYIQVYQSADWNAHLNRDYSDRFVVIGTGVQDVDLYNPLRHVNFYKRLDRLHIKYDGIDASQASAAENHIYLLLLSNQPVNHPTVRGTSRFKFYDN